MVGGDQTSRPGDDRAPTSQGSLPPGHLSGSQTLLVSFSVALAVHLCERLWSHRTSFSDSGADIAVIIILMKAISESAPNSSWSFPSLLYFLPSRPLNRLLREASQRMVLSSASAALPAEGWYVCDCPRASERELVQLEFSSILPPWQQCCPPREACGRTAGNVSRL